MIQLHLCDALEMDYYAYMDLHYTSQVVDVWCYGYDKVFNTLYVLMFKDGMDVTRYREDEDTWAD
jgi:hypothetical protein